jgi:Hg(II)-responsive transcriptional regulator
MEMNHRFTIGELANNAGVNVQTIRYYERRGLINPAARTGAGYRLYDKQVLKRLRFIRRAKGLGFTLKEIKGLLDLRIESAADCDIAKEKVEAKLKAVEQRINALDSVRKILVELMEACDRRQTTGECPILKAIEDTELTDPADMEDSRGGEGGEEDAVMQKGFHQRDS